MEKTYETENYVIVWKPEVCQHSANCLNGAPAVFDVNRKPWIMPENGTEEEILRVIDTCPSGALSYHAK